MSSSTRRCCVAEEKNVSEGLEEEEPQHGTPQHVSKNKKQKTHKGEGNTERLRRIFTATLTELVTPFV